jgi:hypothetical protein
MKGVSKTTDMVLSVCETRQESGYFKTGRLFNGRD